ncbi:MAG: hypothetical protein ACF8OB_05030 [Phycisphaeraceae bacterium JB051]
MAESTMRRGGLQFILAGEAGPVNEKVDKESGELRASCNVAFWGGSEYCRLASPEEGKFIRPGSWVKMIGDVREFKDNKFAGSYQLISVNDQPVEKLVNTSKK